MVGLREKKKQKKQNKIIQTKGADNLNKNYLQFVA